MTEGLERQSEEVTWDVDGIVVYGTLTHPVGTGLQPAIVFVAGSGPTDRDWCSPLLPGTNGSARLLANALTKKGFVTLRCLCGSCASLQLRTRWTLSITVIMCKN